MSNAKDKKALREKIYLSLPVCSGSGAATCTPKNPSKICIRATQEILSAVQEYVEWVIGFKYDEARHILNGKPYGKNTDAAAQNRLIDSQRSRAGIL